jgi:hypothetical protein
MTSRICCRFVPFVVLSITALAVSAADKEQKPIPKKPGTFITAEEGGPDFAVQGEYEGEIEKKGKLGAQVVALGDSKFDVYFLTGGLPGAGWDTKGRTKIAAKTEGGKTIAKGKEYEATIADGTLVGKPRPAMPSRSNA